MPNLLINPSFLLSAEGVVGKRGGTYGWTIPNGHFKRISWKPANNPGYPLVTSPYPLVESDNDATGAGGRTGWFPGNEDWLRQKVFTSEPHTQVLFGHRGIHHWDVGPVYIELLGSRDDWLTSEVLFHVDGIPYERTYTGRDFHVYQQTVQTDHPYLEVVVYAKYEDESYESGWKFGDFILEAS